MYDYCNRGPWNSRFQTSSGPNCPNDHYNDEADGFLNGNGHKLFIIDTLHTCAARGKAISFVYMTSSVVATLRFGKAHEHHTHFIVHTYQ